MKGKIFFSQFESLSDKEKRQLLKIAKASKDKRFLYLKDFLQKIPEDNEKMNQRAWLLTNKYFPQKNEKEKDLFIRRVYNFLNNQIEDLKLLKYLSKEIKYRSLLLANVYEKDKNFSLYEMYLDKSLKEAEKSKDYHLKGHLLDRMININGSIQDSKILAVVKQLIAERYTSLEYAHQADLSSFYRLLSNLHLDGLSLQKIGSNESNILQKIDAEIKQAPSTIFVADYLITKARFVFFDEPLLKSYTQEAKDYIYAQKMNTDSKNKLLRRLYFLEITSGFHFGYDVQEMLAVSQKMHAINLRYKFADAFGFLFYLLYLFANQKHNEMKLELQKNKTLFFRNENQYFINFIQVLSLINQGEYEKTVHYFQELSYASNFYISIWSKLIEFYVNFKLGNLRLCFSLLERIKQSLLKHKLLTFTCESSTILLKVYRKLLQNPTMTLGSLPEGIKSPLHVFLFTQLSKN